MIFLYKRLMNNYIFEYSIIAYLEWALLLIKLVNVCCLYVGEDRLLILSFIPFSICKYEDYPPYNKCKNL